MRTWTPIWLALAFTVNAHANTFVGNGGNRGDVELTVTLMQIRETFTAINTKSDPKPMLCECNKTYKGRPICEPLTVLNETQAKFCNDTLYKMAPEMLKLVDQRERIHFRWTNDTIEVNDTGKDRDSDAVANPARKEIVINQPRFMQMTPAERVFLLTHELMHFTQLDGKELTDKGEVGPFGGEDGSRTLINSMASAAGVMQGAYPKEIKRYKAKLYRSQAWKPFWFTLDLGAAGPTAQYDDNYQFNNFARGQFSFRYQGTHWGIMTTYRHEWQDGSVKDTIKTHEMIDSLGVGPTYRIFFSDDPLTFWGQSHLLIHAMVEYVHAQYHWAEDVPGAPTDLHQDYSANALGGNIGVSYYLPLFFGMWGYVGVACEYHPYKYTETDPALSKITPTFLNYNNPLITGNIGVGYAF